jgi:hypothetical protein
MVPTVGQPYGPAQAWTAGEETPLYDFTDEGHELTLRRRRIRFWEVRTFRTNVVELGLFADGPFGVLTYRFGTTRRGFMWDYAPINWHLVAAPGAVPPPVKDGLQAPLDVFLIKSWPPQIVAAVRRLVLPPEFTRALHSVLRDQAERPWSASELDRARDETYRKCPRIEDLVNLCKYRTQVL